MNVRPGVRTRLHLLRSKRGDEYLFEIRTYWPGTGIVFSSIKDSIVNISSAVFVILHSVSATRTEVQKAFELQT